jgi:ribonuclease HI
MSSLFEHSGESIVAYCDGGSRGNPGPAGFGVYIQDSAGKVLGELSQFLGTQFAIANGHRTLRVVSDSELMVKQIKGQYRVNSPELRPLYEEAKRRITRLEHFQIQHVLREKNRHADRLANVAMDRGMGRAPAATPAPAPAQTAPAPNKGVMLRGLVKNGVVHVLGGQLPDGTFVKVIPE